MGRVFFNTRKNVHALAAAYTVLASDSGKVFTIDQDAAYTVTLPSDQEGLNYRFVLTDAGSNDVKIDSGASNGMKGFSMDPSTGINAVDNNLVKFASGTSVIGDYIEIWNDGTTWWVESFSSATDGIVGANS
jgi:hypothetical protein